MNDKQNDPQSNPATPTTPSAAPPSDHFDDHSMELIMGRLLQVGVLLASVVMLIGGILYLLAYDKNPTNLRTFTSGAAAFRSTGALLHDSMHGSPAAIIQIGILLLIATPIARVIFAAIAFAIERDRLYVAISLVILTVLLMSFFHSH